MGIIKGEKEYSRFKKGETLTRKETMLAHCYHCNGEKESAQDCEVVSRPMYPYHHFRQREGTF